MLLIAAVSAVSALLGSPIAALQGDQTAAVRRIAATAALAAQEYALGVKDGVVVLQPEVEEARLFLTEARRSAGLLPLEGGAQAVADLDRLLVMVRRAAPADSVALLVRSLSNALASRFHVSLDEIPSRAPALALGAETYRTQCVSCHGALGRGDGPAAPGLTPAPADLGDFRALAAATPLDFYRRITIGIAGTAMPAYESRLTPEERWAVALYASTLRLPPASGKVPAALRAFAGTARLSDSELGGILAPGSDPVAPGVRAQVAAIRSFRAVETDAEAAGLVFSRVREQLDSALALARAGRGEAAGTTAFDAYMTFEEVERGVRAKNPTLANTLEAGFADLRTRAASGAAAAELHSLHVALLGDLEKAERTVGDRLSPVNLFLQSFVLLLREGLEAILVVGALMTFLVKTGAGGRRRDLHIGVVAAIGASLMTALLLETIFQVSRARQEALEGGVMLLATVMLFYVSYWLLSKMEVAKWNRFVKGRVQDAVSSGSALALASVAFLAVYREGFETVLFYKALFLASPGSAMPVVVGMVAGGIALALVYFAINRWGVRIPLKPFFGVTSAFLYYMAFVFAGKGIAELQEGGVVGTTIVSWAPRLPALGIYPTVESLTLQGVLLLLLAAGLVWTFILEPRRLPVTRVMLPDSPHARVAETVIPTERPMRLEQDMLRALDRMDTDLAQLRAEVERLKSMLLRSSSSRSGS